jgi:hypothetical protein
MTTYTIIPKVDHTGFHVAIVCTDGVRQTILGFQTQADAEAWISQDKWQSAAERRLIRLNQRTEQVLRDYSCYFLKRTRPQPISGRNQRRKPRGR